LANVETNNQHKTRSTKNNRYLLVHWTSIIATLCRFIWSQWHKRQNKRINTAVSVD